MKQKPIADDSMKRAAQTIFPFKEQTPATYVAREGHHWFCFSFSEYDFEDENLNEWIQAVAVLLKEE